MTFNPFGKIATSELDKANLAALVDVSEGWFIEYKREPCSPKKYAKEASAFANSRGGWIFIGLEEDTSTRKPAGGPGVSSVDAVRLMDAARDAIVQNLSPPPFVELRTVNGPIPELSIAEDRSIIVIHVPESNDTPHIHCSGRVYVRRVDVADPVEITDRAQLDELYARKAKLRDFADEQLNLGFDERWARDIQTPWIHVALIPNPANTTEPAPLKLGGFRRIIKETKGGINLPDVYSSALGYIARNHRMQEVPHGAAVTFEYAHNGAMFITIPLSSMTIDLPPFTHPRVG